MTKYLLYIPESFKNVADIYENSLCTGYGTPDVETFDSLEEAYKYMDNRRALFYHDYSGYVIAVMSVKIDVVQQLKK